MNPKDKPRINQTMKFPKSCAVIFMALTISGCASLYNEINPASIGFLSNDSKNLITLEYKYELLERKYAKKENKSGVKLIAVKISNDSEKDIVFGKDVSLMYENGSELFMMETSDVYKSLKQNSATYLLYLLLTPMTFDVTENGQVTSSTPVGLAVGPGIAGYNVITASSSNKRFGAELVNYNMLGETIKRGESKTGLIGIRSSTYDAIRLMIK